MRRHILAIVLSAHWVAVFGLLAFLSVSDPHFGLLGAAQFLGFNAEEGLAVGNAKFAALSGMTFALASAIFLWMFVEALAGYDGRESSSFHQSCRRAVAGGISSLLLFFVLVCWLRPDDSNLLTVECILAAVLLSYLCICAEQFFCWWLGADGGEEVSPARGMALSAAHATLLSRISGRPGEIVQERL